MNQSTRINPIPFSCILLFFFNITYSQSTLHTSSRLCSDVISCKKEITSIYIEIESIKKIIDSKILNLKENDSLLSGQSTFESSPEFINRISTDINNINSWKEFHQISKRRKDLYEIQTQVFETKNVSIDLDKDNYDANNEKWYFQLTHSELGIQKDTLYINKQDAKYLYKNLDNMKITGFLNFEFGDKVSLVGFSIEDVNFKLVYHFEKTDLINKIKYITKGSKSYPRSLTVSNDNYKVAITHSIYPPEYSYKNEVDRHEVYIYNFNTDKVYIPSTLETTAFGGVIQENYYARNNKLFFSPDGQFLVICDGLNWGQSVRQSNIHVIDLKKRTSFTIELPFGCEDLSPIYFSSDSRLFAISGDYSIYTNYSGLTNGHGHFFKIFSLENQGIYKRNNNITFLPTNRVNNLQFSRYGYFLLVNFKYPKNTTEIYNFSNQKKIDVNPDLYENMFYDLSENSQEERFEMFLIDNGSSPNNIKFQRLNKFPNVDRIHIIYKKNKDCTGDYDGSAIIDSCGHCVEGGTGKKACVKDCNGDYGGGAFIDDCGSCAGGNTGKLQCLKVLYNSGELKLEINYYNNGELRLEINYYESGALKSETNYYESGALKLEINYHENGALKSETNYNNQSVVVVKKEWYDSGQLKSEINYYDSGQLKSKTTYNSSGLLHGTIRERYINQQIKSEFFYKDGLLEDGEHKRWEENGTVSSVIKFSKGKKKGRGVEYDEKGKKTRKFKIDRYGNEI